MPGFPCLGRRLPTHAFEIVDENRSQVCAQLDGGKEILLGELLVADSRQQDAAIRKGKRKVGFVSAFRGTTTESVVAGLRLLLPGDGDGSVTSGTRFVDFPRLGVSRNSGVESIQQWTQVFVKSTAVGR